MEIDYEEFEQMLDKNELVAEFLNKDYDILCIKEIDETVIEREETDSILPLLQSKTTAYKHTVEVGCNDGLCVGDEISKAILWCGDEKIIEGRFPTVKITNSEDIFEINFEIFIKNEKFK